MPVPSGTSSLLLGRERDIAELHEYPMSDGHLATALEYIESCCPRAVGLDLFRDIPTAGSDGDPSHAKPLSFPHQFK